MSNDLNVTTVGSETNLMSPWSILVSIFYEPSRVFRSIKEKSTWLIPFIVVLVVIATSAYFVTPIAISEQSERVRTDPNISDQQREQQLMGMKFMSNPALGSGMAIIGSVFMIFVYTGVLMLFANVVFGGKARFSQVFSLVVVSSLIWVASSIVKTPLIMAKASADIRTSLAMILPANANPSPLYHFLNTYTDVFFIWETILVIIGVKIIYDFATQKAVLAVLIPTAIMAMITTALSALA